MVFVQLSSGRRFGELSALRVEERTLTRRAAPSRRADGVFPKVLLLARHSRLKQGGALQGTARRNAVRMGGLDAKKAVEHDAQRP